MIYQENQIITEQLVKLHGIGSDLNQRVSTENPSLFPKVIELEKERQACQ